MKQIDRIEKIVMSRSGVLYLRGKPGIAKSAMHMSIAEKNELLFIDNRLSQLDSSEILGIPFKEVINGINVMTYAPPKWFYIANNSINMINPKTGKNYKGALVMFDELNRATLEVRNASLQILLDRQIGFENKFAEHVYFSSAGNLGDEDGCEVEEFDNALNGRLVHMECKLEFKEWVSNFAKKHVHPSIIEFLDKNPDHIYKITTDGGAYASYRSWTFFSNFVGKEAKIEEIYDEATNFASNYVGSSSATRLIQYLREVLELSKSLSIKDILKGYKTKIKSNLSKYSRDRISQVISELKTLDMNDFSEGELNNVIEFLKDVDKDECFSYLNYLLLLNTDKYASKDGSKLSRNFEIVRNNFKPELAMMLDGLINVEKEKK